jgi:hypothetical protein
MISSAIGQLQIPGHSIDRVILCASLGGSNRYFAVQDEITTRVIGAIEPSLMKAEIDRIKRPKADNLNAYVASWSRRYSGPLQRLGAKRTCQIDSP